MNNTSLEDSIKETKLCLERYQKELSDYNERLEPLKIKEKNGTLTTSEAYRFDYLNNQLIFGANNNINWY